jgi:DNA-binding transcriptional ArsR family regulator
MSGTGRSLWPIWEDSELCAAAKGVWAYMRSRPHGWDFSAERIGRALGMSKPTALKHMKELEVRGYLYGRRVGTGGWSIRCLLVHMSVRSGLRWKR